MCLAIPAEVIERLGEGSVRVRFGETTSEVRTDMVEPVEVGDYVIVHVGFALQKMDREAAAETLAMIREMESQFNPERELDHKFQD